MSVIALANIRIIPASRLRPTPGAVILALSSGIIRTSGRVATRPFSGRILVRHRQRLDD
jgi:hypothetical protein